MVFTQPVWQTCPLLKHFRYSIIFQYLFPNLSKHLAFAEIKLAHATKIPANLTLGRHVCRLTEKLLLICVTERYGKAVDFLPLPFAYRPGVKAYP